MVASTKTLNDPKNQILFCSSSLYVNFNSDIEVMMLL